MKGIEKGEKENIPEVAETELAGAPETKGEFQLVDANAEIKAKGATKCLVVPEGVSSMQVQEAALEHREIVVPGSEGTKYDEGYALQFPGDEKQEICTLVGIEVGMKKRYRQPEPGEDSQDN